MKVELHQACVWTCDQCGRDNFCRMVKAELSPEEQADINRHFGVENWGGESELEGEVEMLSIPKRVKCEYCEAQFETEAPWAETWDDGDYDEECPR